MIERSQAQLGTATWADLLARRYGRSDRRRFVGRRHEQEQFRLNYLYEVPPVLLFVLQGPAGIGKTALLARYREIADEHRALTAVVSRGDLTLPREFAILQAMEILADQLAAAGTPLTTYREVYREYLKAVRSIDADSAAPGRVWSLFDGAADPDPWVQEAWDTYFTRTLSLRQSTLIRDPVGTLTERFIKDLNAWAVVRRMVLCFDDWGQTDSARSASDVAEPSLFHWLPTLLCRGQLSTNIWFVLTTRSELDPRWEPLLPVTRIFALQPLPKKESVSLLQSSAVTYEELSADGLSEAEACAIVEQVKGMPLNLVLLSSGRRELSAAALPDESTYLDQYIDSLKPVQQAALLTCTTARSLDEGVLSVLLGDETSREAIAWLTSSPLTVHLDAISYFRRALREPLLKSARTRIGPAWEAAHQTLFGYYRQRVELEGTKPHYLDAQWRHDRLEALYHELVQAEEPESICHVLLSFLEGIRRFYPWAGAVALTWLDALHVRASTSGESGSRLPTPGHQLAAKIYATWLALVERRWEDSLSLVDEALALVDQLGSPEELEATPAITEVKEQFNNLRHLVASRLALPPAPDPEPEREPVDVVLKLMERDAAPEPGTVAPSTSPTGTAAEAARDIIVDSEVEADGTEPSVERPTIGAIPEVPDACEVETPSEEPLEVQEETKRTKAVELCVDANARLSQGDYEAAIQGYDEALTQSSDYVAAYYNRGSAYTHIGALDAAVADFTEVLKLDPAQAQAHRQRGLIYARKGNYELAIQDYDAALALLRADDVARIEPRAVGAIVYDRANAYFRLGSYEQALADYSETLQHMPDHVEAHINRGLTYSALGNYPEALRDFNRAIVIAPQQALTYHHRGQLYARLGRYSEALNDYGRALELNPRSATVHNNRGLLYVKIEAYPEAIEAYQRAMALQPDWATPYYNAACAAALMGDIEHACVWLARAIGLREAYRAMAVRDPDLATIREHPRFRILVEVGS